MEGGDAMFCPVFDAERSLLLNGVFHHLKFFGHFPVVVNVAEIVLDLKLHGMARCGIMFRAQIL